MGGTHGCLLEMLVLSQCCVPLSRWHEAVPVLCDAVLKVWKAVPVLCDAINASAVLLQSARCSSVSKKHQRDVR
jgi:hypothetical protein